jgi:predicted SAM-dependent methyltransferase
VLIEEAMKLNLGSGNVRMEGFTNVDLYDETADIHADIADLPFIDSSVDEIACIQVVEHIHIAESERVLAEMYRVLKPGAYAVVETPDIDVVCRRILEDGLTEGWVYNLVGQYWRPGDKERYKDWYHHAGSIHRNPWNFGRLSMYAERVGFTVERLPWQDSHYPCEENLCVKLTKPV